MDERSDKNYKALALIPMLTFLGSYIGYRVVFTIVGTESPFGEVPHYVAAMAAIVIAMISHGRNTPTSKKIDIYCKGAGNSGVTPLGIIVLMAGGFSFVVAAMGGEEPIVNMGLTLIPSHFLIPGILIVTCFTSTCIDASMGTQVAMIPIAVAVAQGAGLNVAMAGTAVIAGTYSGDNLSTISDTTICVTKGVGAGVKDKFKMNSLVALPATMITIVLYSVLGTNGGSPMDIEELHYSILEVLPYLAALMTVIAGLDVLLVLLIDILMSGVIGTVIGIVTFFEWTMAIGAGVEEMSSLAVFSMPASGLIKPAKYYGSIAQLAKTMTEKIKNRKGYEYLISLVSMAISGTTLNSPVAIIMTAPVMKELGSKYGIAPERLTSLLDIFPCGASMLVPCDSSILLAQQCGRVAYLEIVRFTSYLILSILFACVMIQFGLSRVKEERESGL